MNIAEILKHCPKGTKLYSPAYGEVNFIEVTSSLTIKIKLSKLFGDNIKYFFNNGNIDIDGECMLFPSYEQRDWSKFVVSGQETKTQFKTFDKVLVRDSDSERWQPAFFSVFKEGDSEYKFSIIYLDVPAFYRQCIPYEGNEHLLGTTNKP